MVAGTSTRRSDGELEFMLYETAIWTVMGPHGRVHCEVASLRLAVDEAGELGGDVSALIRVHPTKIVVFPGQIRTLANQLAEPEPYPTLQVMEA